MEEIKVGECIRTERGYIGKIKRIEFDNIDKDLKWYVFDYKEPKMNITKEIYINKPYIKKHSFNIIDLIQIEDIVEVVTEKDFEGEYTEKFEVAAVRITDCKGNKLNEIGICGDDGIEYVSLKDIRTILTHEQYERNCYRLENN